MYTAVVRPPVVLISAGHLNSYLTHLLAKIKTHTAESGGEKRKKKSRTLCEPPNLFGAVYQPAAGANSNRRAS